jgi:hypothetical protein
MEPNSVKHTCDRKMKIHRIESKKNTAEKLHFKK